MERICSRCEKPLSDRYWLQIFYADGRTEKRSCGELNGNEGPHVAVWIDFKCKRGAKGKIVQEHPIDTETVVAHETGLYVLKDMRIMREGKRILLVMPKMVGVMER